MLFFAGYLKVSKHSNLTISSCFQHSEDSWSEEEGDVSEDDHQPRRRTHYSTLSSEGAFSEEESNMSEASHATPDGGLLSTGSAENLQQELAKCTCISDGLSDKEMTVKRMRNQVINSPERSYEVCPSSKCTSTPL